MKNKNLGYLIFLLLAFGGYLGAYQWPQWKKERRIQHQVLALQMLQRGIEISYNQKDSFSGLSNQDAFNKRLVPSAFLPQNTSSNSTTLSLSTLNNLGATSTSNSIFNNFINLYGSPIQLSPYSLTDNSPERFYRISYPGVPASDCASLVKALTPLFFQINVNQQAVVKNLPGDSAPQFPQLSSQQIEALCQSVGSGGETTLLLIGPKS